tara:strand:+ start:5619 stop:6101 length:483 start_codon:yes stop_codon:yes gene_type:complete
MTDLEMHAAIVAMNRATQSASAEDAATLSRFMDYVVRLRAEHGETGWEAQVWESRQAGEWLLNAHLVADNLTTPEARRAMLHLDCIWESLRERARGYYKGIQRLRRGRARDLEQWTAYRDVLETENARLAAKLLMVQADARMHKERADMLYRTLTGGGAA